MNNIPKEKLEKILTLFHLLRNENRFKILLLLMEKEMNVSELQEEIGGTQSWPCNWNYSIGNKSYKWRLLKE